MEYPLVAAALLLIFIGGILTGIGFGLKKKW